MGRKKNTTDEVVKEQVISKEVTIQEKPRRELVLEGDPEAQLAYAKKAADALMTIVQNKPKPVIIQGKQYLEYGDWQVLGRFYGATVEIEWTHEIANPRGYEARAIVRRNGEVISSAEGMCTRDERRWKTADDYAIRSMAQTRTAAKALRNAFGWVAELAGYQSTPAEEIPQEPVKPDFVSQAKMLIKSAKTDERLNQVWDRIAISQNFTDMEKEMLEGECAARAEELSNDKNNESPDTEGVSIA